MKKFTIGLSMAALVMTGSAYAAPGDARAKIDANGDGVIARSEAQTAASAMFARLDVNKDGKLDQADREQRRQQMKAARFDRLDANKDGQISRQEFTADTRSGKRGANRDGATAGEARKSGTKGERGRRLYHDGRHGGMMGMMRMADTNKDGAISQAEFTASALKHFDAADTNKDGQVTAQEQQAVREQMKAKWQQMRAQKSQN